MRLLVYGKLLVAKPNDDGIYTWNETIQNWEQI
jgi:hypothetical protein